MNRSTCTSVCGTHSNMFLYGGDKHSPSHTPEHAYTTFTKNREKATRSVIAIFYFKKLLSHSDSFFVICHFLLVL